jgi:hypothetical protein
MMSVTRCTEATIAHRGACLAHQRRSVGDLADRILDQALDLLGRTGRALRQRAHFAGHHRKAPALLAGTRASTAAFSARMLVWKAMPSMTLMISAIFFDEASMADMVVTTWPTTSPPCEATPCAPMASWLAWRACSAFCARWRSVPPSIAAVSSRLAACCSVRRDRSVLPEAISPAARLMLDAGLDAADDLLELIDGGVAVVACGRTRRGSRPACAR